MENNATPKKQLPAYLILTIIAVVAAVVLAITNMVTKGPIAEHAMAALKEAFNAVMPADSYEEMTVPEGYEVSSLYAAKKGDEVIGYCVTAASNGYASSVAVTLGVDTDGVVTGCSVGDTNFAETAGFGARAKEAAFQEQFKGISAVDGGSFDALSGATITSEAVRSATNKNLRCVAEVALGKTMNSEVTFGAPAAKEEAAPLTGNVQEGKAKGFQSDVTVQLVMDGGKISALQIGSGDETPGFGTRCAEDEAFINQFIGQTGPFTLGKNIDALSGATVTSTAVVEAVNAALNAEAAPAAPAVDGIIGTAKGFQSEVSVTVQLAEDGTIAALSIGSADETPGFGTRCAEDEAFKSQFLGKKGPFAIGEGIDALSGATVTSTAVVEAINTVMNADPAPAVETSAAAGKTGTAKGFQSDVKVEVTLAEDGTIAALVINSADETAGFGTRCAEDEAFLNQFIGKKAPLTIGEGIDALSGATVTSTAVVEAINAAAAPAAEPAAAGKTGTAKGFQSDVKVEVTLAEDGTIAALVINSADETAGFGTRCAEDEAFLNQFIGKKAPFAVGENVDALSGATVTSTAVVEAINAAVAQ